MSAVSALRETAYRADGLLKANPDYVQALRDLGTDGHGEVLVAADGDRLLGTIMFEPWHDHSEIARGADEAEVRAFAVAPQARGRGVGKLLVEALVERAREEGVSQVLLLTHPDMVSAQYVYRARGFVRFAQRDWEPIPGVRLMAYRLTLKD